MFVGHCWMGGKEFSPVLFYFTDLRTTEKLINFRAPEKMKTIFGRFQNAANALKFSEKSIQSDTGRLLILFPPNALTMSFHSFLRSTVPYKVMRNV